MASTIVSAIIVGIVILLIFTLFGFFTWACSDIPLALREIAVNTRHEKSHGSSYALLKLLSIIIRIFAILTWAIGIFLSYYFSYSLLLGNSGINFLSLFSRSIQ